MLNLDPAQSAEDSLEKANVVRQLGPELESELATPQRGLLKQRLFSDTFSEANEELLIYEQPTKLLKGSDSTAQILISDDLNPLFPRHNFNPRGKTLASKENVKPRILNRQQGQKFVQPLKLKHDRKSIELTPEEEFRLLEEWEANFFIDFNSWLQVAKAKITSSLDEKVHEESANAERIFKTKSYQCHLKLFFSDSSSDAVFSNGVGKSKKEARKMAIKQMVTILIQRKLITKGLKDKSFLYKGVVDKDSTKLMMKFGMPVLSSKMDSSAEEREKRLQKEIKRLNKRMHHNLREDNFIEACQAFCQIICNKSPDWNEVSQIWSHAILKKELKYARVILDLLLYKRVKKTLAEELEEDDTTKVEGLLENQNFNSEFLNKRAESQRLLKNLYGFERTKSENPYDIVDIVNFKYSVPELTTNPTGPVLSDLNDPVSFSVGIDELSSRLQVISTEELNHLIRYDEDEGLDNETFLSTKDYERGFLDFDPSACNIKIDQTSNKEFKDPNLNYIDAKLINEMYEMAIYSGDLKFSLQVAEMLYSRSLINDKEFISPYAAYYFNHKKNMLQLDLIETVYKSYQNFENTTDGLVRLEGKLEKIGYKFRQQVLTFTPDPRAVKNGALDKLIIRRGITVEKEIHDIRENTRVNEKEYVLLVALEGEQEVKMDPEFNDLLNEEGGFVRTSQGSKSKGINFETIQESSIFQKYVQQGRRIRHVMLGFINDISKDFVIKLYVLPTTQQSLDITETNANFDWVLVRKPVVGQHFASDFNLYEYTSKNESSPAISHILMSPPLVQREYLKQIFETRANLQMHQSQKTKNQIKTILLEQAKRLDNLQLQAIENALCKSFSLVQAPEISGKIAVIVEIILSWLVLSQGTILLCSNSNIKVDMLHNALCNAGVKSVRIMASPDEEGIETITNEFKESIDRLRNATTFFNAYYIRYPILKKIMGQAQVVCTTLDALSGEYMAGTNFQRVIVDDACSSVEPLVLGAFTKFCQHAVLFGDHKTIAPKATSELSITKGLKISLFERLVRQGYPFTFLDYQYLLNPSIAFYPSLRFYDANLKSGLDQEQLPIIQGFEWPNSQIGLCFVNINDIEEHTQGSIQNTREAEVVVKLYMKFLTAGELSINEIGVLTPYLAQKNLLKKALAIAREKYPSIFSMNNTSLDENIMVEHINSEKYIIRDLIIISTVRNNEDNNLGVLRDPRLLNSMVTKGRRGVIIVGNLRTLTRNEAWRDFIFWAQSNNIIFNYNQLLHLQLEAGCSCASEQKS